MPRPPRQHQQQHAQWPGASSASTAATAPVDPASPNFAQATPPQFPGYLPPAHTAGLQRSTPVAEAPKDGEIIIVKDAFDLTSHRVKVHLSAEKVPSYTALGPVGIQDPTERHRRYLNAWVNCQPWLGLDIRDSARRVRIKNGELVLTAYYDQGQQKWVSLV